MCLLESVSTTLPFRKGERFDSERANVLLTKRRTSRRIIVCRKQHFFLVLAALLGPYGGSQSATSLQPNVSAGYRQNGNATPDANVADEKDPKAPATNGCSGVADEAPPTEGVGALGLSKFVP